MTHARTRSMRVGFVPLVDSASVIVAARRGFAEEEGLRLELSRERSWASVRDKLSLGYLDAAHILSPMLVASRMGLGNFRSPLMTPVMLSRAGNEVTLGADLVRLCEARLGYRPATPGQWAHLVGTLSREGRAKGGTPLTFACVFPFSSHTYLLRDWLAMGDLSPDRDVHLTVLPPAMMADALAEGTIDGFCAGPPWGRLAQERGAGHVAFRAVHLERGVPEKALALRANDPLRDRETVLGLIRAVRAASRWVADEANGDELFALLARADAVGVPAPTIRAAIDRSGMSLWGDDTLRPRAAFGRWIARQMVRAGQLDGGGDDGVDPDADAVAAFRTDLFDEAALRCA